MDLDCIEEEQFDGKPNGIVDDPDLENIVYEPATTSSMKIVSTCNKCHEEFSNANELDIHAIIHTNEKYCPLCKRPFKRRNEFLMHAKAHLRALIKSKPHRCKLCSKSFQTEQMLRVHTFVHTKEWPFKCTKCSNSYKTVSMLRYHEVTHLQPEDRNKRKFVCQICKDLLTTRSSLRRHLKCVHKQQNDKLIEKILAEASKKVYNCELSSLEFHSKDLYVNHVRNHHSDQIIECKYCKKHYASLLAALNVHLEVKHSPKCHYCNEMFASPAELFNHVKQCHQTCNQCRISFLKNSDYKYHMTTHSDWHIQCKVCQKMFFTKRGHDIHMMRIHSTELQFKSFKCDQCDKAFKSYSLMKKHRLIHKRTRKQFACTSCGRYFATEENLKVHAICHMKQGKIICDVCNKSFLNVQTLRRHYLKFHKSKTKNDSCHQTCNQCRLSFLKNSDYKYHMTTHSDWHIQCKMCPKKFFNKNGRTLHMRLVHWRELQFKCDQCDTMFTSHSLMKKHNCNMKQIACTSCGRSFDTEENLKMHAICHMKQGEIICDVCNKHFSYATTLRKHYLKFHKSKTKNDSSRTAVAPEDFGSNNVEQATSKDELQTLVKSEYPKVCVKVEEYEEIDIKIEELY